MENTTIIKFVKEHGGELFNKNFVGVYPVDKLTDIISNIEKTDYPFCIFNTDPIKNLVHIGVQQIFSMKIIQVFSYLILLEKLDFNIFLLMMI